MSLERLLVVAILVVAFMELLKWAVLSLYDAWKMRQLIRDFKRRNRHLYP